MKKDLAFAPSSREYVPAAASRSLAPIVRVGAFTGGSEDVTNRMRLLSEAFLWGHADARAGNPAERGGLRMIVAIHTGCGTPGGSASRSIPSRRPAFAKKELGGVHEGGGF